MELMLTRVTPLAGALFLIWLFFSPIIGSLILSQLSQDVYFLDVLGGVLLTYVVLGIIFYQVAKQFGIVEEPQLADMIPLEDVSNLAPDHVGNAFKMLLLSLPLIIFWPVIYFGDTFPILAGLIGTLVFVGTCIANWYPPVRERVYQSLVFTKTVPAVDRYRAQSVLQAVNAPAIFVSGFLIISCLHYLFP